MCQNVKDIYVLFGLQESDMGELISLIWGVKLATSVNKGDELSH